jgi:hypothetical protein
MPIRASDCTWKNMAVFESQCCQPATILGACVDNARGWLNEGIFDKTPKLVLDISSCTEILHVECRCACRHKGSYVKDCGSG